MLPENPFLQLTLPRANRALSRIESLIWTEIAPIPCSFAGSNAAPVKWESARKLAFKPVKLPFHWGKLFDQGWFKLDLPKVKAKGPVYLHWNDQGEGTAYLDGVPFYGFDVAHRYCALPEKAGAVYIESLCLQSAIWHPTATGLDPRGSKLGKAALFTRDDLAWEVWHDFRMLYELALEEAKANHPTVPPKTWGSGYAQPVDIVTPLYRRLLRALDDAVNALDRGGLPAMRKVLRQAYQKFEGQADRIRAVLTGHAHIDLVWLWPERTGEYKATHTFSTMNRLMDLYPEFVFGYSQPASYDAVKRISPRLMDQVKKRIAGGKWEALGAIEVESDTLFTPPLPYRGRAVSAGWLGLDGVESLVPCWAKPAGDGRGWILRLHETMGRRGKVRLRLAGGLQAFQTDLSEAIKDNKPIREITVSPYELISLRIR